MGKRFNRKRVCAALLGVGMLLVVLGIWQGDYQDNWGKAAMICLECIGIG